MIEIIFTLMIIGASLYTGKHILRLFGGIAGCNAPEQKLISIALGIGAVSFAVFFLGIAGFLYKNIFIFLLVLPNIFLLVSLVRGTYSLTPLRPSLPKEGNSLLIILILAASVVHIVSAYLPATDSDALTYHLTFPKYFVQAERIYNISSLGKYTTFPQFTEMLYTLGLALKSEIVAQLIHTLFALLTAIAIYILCTSYFSVLAALLASLMFLLSPVVFELAGTAMIDLALCFYITMTFLTLLKWHYSGNRTYLLLSAVFAAFSFGTKYTGLFALLVFIIFLFSKRQNFSLRNIVYFLSLYTIVVSPWLLRNFTFTGNPFSPFMAGIFKDSSLNSYILMDLKNHLAACKDAGNFTGYFTYLFKVFYDTPETFLIFALPLFRKSILNKTPIVFLCISSIMYLVYNTLFLPHIYRFSVPAFPFLFILTSLVMLEIWKMKNKTWVKAPVLFIIISILGYRAFTLGHKILRKENLPYLTGSMSKERYLENNLDFYPIVPFVNASLSNEDKILSLNENRAYYFNQKFIIGHSSIEGSIAYTSTDTDDIINELKKKNIGYIFTNRSEYFQSHKRESVLNEHLDKNCDIILTKGTAYLYKIK